MKLKRIHIKLSITREELLFIAAFTMFMLSTVLELTKLGAQISGEKNYFPYLFKIMRYLSYGICMFKIFYDSVYVKRRILMFIFASTITMLSFLGSLNKTMVLYILLFLAVENISSKKVIYTAFILQLLIWFGTVLSSQIGLVEDIVRDPETRVRHFLGFAWLTNGPILFLYMLLEYIFIRKGKLTIIEFSCLMLIDCWLYRMTDSRMAFAMSAVIIIFFFLFGKYIQKGEVTKKLRGFFFIAPECIAIFAVILHDVYDEKNHYFFEVNNLLSGRLKLGHDAIRNYGIPLFGQRMEWIGYSLNETLSGRLKGTYNYVDCSYLQIMIEYGLLFLILVLLLYSVIMKYSILHQKYYLSWIILFILLFAVTEPRLVYMAFNPFILLCVTETGEKRMEYDNEMKCDKCLIRE